METQGPQLDAGLTGPASPTQDERTMGLLAHLGAMVMGVFSGSSLGFAVPLFLMVTRGKDSSFIRAQSVESLNFQITLLLVVAVSVVGSLLTCGLGFVVAVPLILVLALAGIVMPIIAGMKANDGILYRYPLTLRLVK